ncbi:MAG: tetratricopeptide repeat protein [Thioalkalispiraceae bacterium]|jgi:TolB-like protein/DNA-binding winged helix-turn-helix (wHTH) protein
MSKFEFDSNVTNFWLGDWRVRPSSCEIERDNAVIKLEPKVMDLLQLLASRPGNVFTRIQLEEHIWPGVIVGYDALTKTVGKLREALGDTGKPSTYVQTIPKKGYRLVAPVTQDDASTSEPVAGSGKVTEGAVPKNRKQLITATISTISVILVLALVLASLYINDSQRPQDQADTAQKPSLIVLPFKNLNNDPQQAYFSQGITDDLITDLSGYSAIQVISSRIAFQYNQSDLNLRALVDELGVRYVVEGSIRRTTEQLRINVQMIDAQRGTNLWAEQYNRPLTSLFDIQDEVRKRIVSALSVKLSEAEIHKEQKRYTSNYQAYDLFLRGQSNLIKRASAVDNHQAREQFEQAIAIDPQFARAYAALAMVNADAYRHDWAENPEVTGRIALQQAHHAIELDPELRFATLANGYVEFFVAANHQQAAAMAERTLKLDPRNADAHLLLATIYVHANEYKKSEAYVESSMRLNPTPPSIYFHIGAIAHLLQGDYPTAVEMLEQSLRVNPERLLGKIYMTITMVRMNRLEDARWYAEEILAASPDFNAEQWANKQPFKDRDINRQLRDDLRKAGLE